jgi:hypothetical protein
MTECGRRFLVNGRSLRSTFLEVDGLKSTVFEADGSEVDSSEADGSEVYVFVHDLGQQLGITVAEIRPVCHVIEGEAAIR